MTHNTVLSEKCFSPGCNRLIGYILCCADVLRNVVLHFEEIGEGKGLGP